MSDPTCPSLPDTYDEPIIISGAIWSNCKFLMAFQATLMLIGSTVDFTEIKSFRVKTSNQNIGEIILPRFECKKLVFYSSHPCFIFTTFIFMMKWWRIFATCSYDTKIEENRLYYLCKIDLKDIYVEKNSFPPMFLRVYGFGEIHILCHTSGGGLSQRSGNRK